MVPIGAGNRRQVSLGPVFDRIDRELSGAIASGIKSARGPEWNRILEKRLAALEPFLGKKILMGCFHRLPLMAVHFIDLETEKVFHFEMT
jgi:hypothetical protein